MVRPQEQGCAGLLSSLTVAGPLKKTNTSVWMAPAKLGRYAAVPIPASVWLLASGLLGLVGLRRKFSR